jgi:D-alanine-D-alanine ligase
MASSGLNRGTSVVVLMGGTSSERLISLKSGQAVLAGLLSLGLEAEGYDVGDLAGLAVFARRRQSSLFFIALHGGAGEDGTVQGLLESIGCVFTGSNQAASALAMDKVLSKRLWCASGVATPPFYACTTEPPSLATLREAGFSLPLMVKPASSGSSLGLGWVHSEADFLPACHEALRHDASLLVEPLIEGSEYTVGILGDQALPPLAIRPAQGRYDYQAKYADAAVAQYHYPCGLSDEGAGRLMGLAQRAFQVLGCSGFGRVDMMADASGRFWVLEVNTVPGLTPVSLLPCAAGHVGLSFEALLERIMDLACVAV